MSALTQTLMNLELLRTVCSFSESSDHPELLRVSRSFFNAAAPLVWENIEGVEKLLLVIPGVKCVPLEGETKTQTIVSEAGLSYIWAPDLAWTEMSLKGYTG
jgi:hypothetical protein